MSDVSGRVLVDPLLLAFLLILALVVGYLIGLTSHTLVTVNVQNTATNDIVTGVQNANVLIPLGTSTTSVSNHSLPQIGRPNASNLGIVYPPVVNST